MPTLIDVDVVVAVGNALGGLGEAAEGKRDAAGNEAGDEHRHHQGAGGQRAEDQAQRGVGRQGLGERTLEDDADSAAAGRVASQDGDERDVVLAAHGNLATGAPGGGEAHGGGEGGAQVRRQGGGVDRPAFIGAGQALELRREIIVDFEAEEGPGHRHRRHQRHRDDLVRVVVQELDRRGGGVGRLGGGGDQRRKVGVFARPFVCRGVLVLAAQGSRHYRPLEGGKVRGIGADAAREVAQGGRHGGDVAQRERRLEGEVAGDEPRRLHQHLLALVHQFLEYAGAGSELALDLADGAAAGGDVHRGDRNALHDENECAEEREEAAAEAKEAPSAQRAGRSRASTCPRAVDRPRTRRREVRLRSLSMVSGGRSSRRPGCQTDTS